MKASDVCPIGSTVIDGFIVGSESACLRGPKIHSRHQRRRIFSELHSRELGYVANSQGGVIFNPGLTSYLCH